MNEFQPRAASYIVATAGHVDHGKSALVRALTGVDPDRLPEEKRRGMTIDLGFASTQLQAAASDAVAARHLDVSFVDVPGHEDYVSNMIAGLGTVDAALLVVAADDGWMPQTEEHLQILIYAGVQRMVVAMSKIDATADFPGAEASIRARLAASPFAEAKLVGTSTRTGAGLEALRSALAALLAQAPPQQDLEKPRLPIDRVFSLRGVGTVVTGTLGGGRLTRGQAVVIQPGGVHARIRALQTHNADVAVAWPGSRVALNLPGVAPAAQESCGADRASRGDVVSIADAGRPTSLIDVWVHRSSRVPLGAARAALTVHTDTTVRVHHGSTSVAGRLRLRDVKSIEPGQSALARLTLAKPILAMALDRCVIRDAGQQHTLAGALVLDADPPRQRGPGAATRQRLLLMRRAAAPHDTGVFLQTRLERDGAVFLRSPVAAAPFSPSRIEAAVDQLLARAEAVAAGELLIDSAWWKLLSAGLTAGIDAYHAAHPQFCAVPFAELKTRAAALVGRRVPAAVRAAVADVLITALPADKFVRTAQGVSRASHRPTLPPRLASAGVAVRKRLAENPLDPPSRNELCKNDLEHQALRFLIAGGEAVELAPAVVISAQAHQLAVQRVRFHLAERGPATVSQLKTVLATSRRIMVPLLERLDRDGVTRRSGDLRTLPEAAVKIAGATHAPGI